ncbi:Sugar kinase of the NBD/HSP70 family, may contain an N-terminal HTH domain [Mycolicibacterium neoaurum]|uniref:ROK family protein n=1 Tax=Mycolicibacterium neoaurum TaxID=1795 RepID=A0AAV2WRW6_MYCNE|nr:ROK family transcriptional regulator [Mycolicibacterium neoaurum]TLH49233.1 ROK family transcriptional regulator [Mycolicibacterium neoaurum]CDQ47120.1 ROK family protein [Mycolicibacterium neoaurum]SDC31031.1 Sugar kinase of the NBD/HSP70 family, may contain an N-terminal HTH domain [Mycolicibacterium neoaurum]
MRGWLLVHGPAPTHPDQRRPRVGTSSDDIRRRNLSSVLTLVHRRRALSRAELTRLTGLSRSTTKDLVEELVARGLVAEAPAATATQVGRPSPIVRPDPRALAVAVTPEVDAVTVGLVSMGGTVSTVIRRATDKVPTADDAVAIAAEEINRIRASLDDEQRIIAVGVAVPGLVHSPESTVQLAPNLDWHDVTIGQMLTEATGLPVCAVNDANAGAIAEHLFGDHHEPDHLIYVNGGPSGIGAGFVVAGDILAGVAGYAGELGHTYVGGAERCHCGSIGCLETEVSQQPLSKLLAQLDDPARQTLSAPGHAERDVLHRQARCLAIALGNAINMLNPRLIVLGGFLRVFPAFAASVLHDELERRTMGAPRRLVRVVPATLGPETLIIGAAELAFAPLLADPGRF